MDAEIRVALCTTQLGEYDIVATRPLTERTLANFEVVAATSKPVLFIVFLFREWALSKWQPPIQSLRHTVLHI